MATTLGEQTLEFYRPPSTQIEFRADELQLLKDTLTQGLTDPEFELFVRACKHTGLDPFHRQIHALKRGGKLSIQVSIDGFRLIADRTGHYAPGRETEYRYDDDGHLKSATAYVKKQAGGTWHEVAFTAFWQEFYPGKRDGFMWDKIPHVMLAKVAEAQALRRAFPAELSGIYAAEEMDQAAEDPPPTTCSRVIPPDKAQQLAILFSKAGYSDQDRLDFASGIIGRLITTFKDLTAAEATDVFNAFEEDQMSRARLEGTDETS